MRGRDPHEAHRVATPLELLFDLTFATSFSLAASHLAIGLPRMFASIEHGEHVDNASWCSAM
jgi:hypothetical protein